MPGSRLHFYKKGLIIMSEIERELNSLTIRGNQEIIAWCKKFLPTGGYKKQQSGRKVTILIGQCPCCGVTGNIRKQGRDCFTRIIQWADDPPAIICNKNGCRLKPTIKKEDREQYRDQYLRWQESAWLDFASHYDQSIEKKTDSEFKDLVCEFRISLDHAYRLAERVFDAIDRSGFSVSDDVLSDYGYDDEFDLDL